MRRDITRVIKKLLAALLLFALAGFIAFWLKDWLDRRSPETAIPQIVVTADGQELASVTSSYTWTFAFGRMVQKDAGSLYEMRLPENALLGGENLEIGFTLEPQSYIISRSEPYSYSFLPSGGDTLVPYESGGYIYEVHARFEQGLILYYFYITIP